MSDDYERRIELATKIATLEERSVQNQAQLSRIEAMLITHAHEEEQILRDINKAVDTFRASVDDKFNAVETDLIRVESDSLRKASEFTAAIESAVEKRLSSKLETYGTVVDTKITTALAPFVEEKNKLLGGWKVLAVIASIVFAVVLAAKDWIFGK